jgi:hypothetical protein
MNREYQLVLSTLPLQDIDSIREDIITYTKSGKRTGEEDADNWEEGLYQVFQSLKIVPYHQECERESKILGTSIRKILYRQKGIRRDYHIYYTIKPYPLPDPEPDHPYMAGRIVIFFLLHAAQKPLTESELIERTHNVQAEIQEIDAIRTELEQSKN